MLNLVHVPVIDIITFDESYLRQLSNNLDTNKVEGYVLRNVESFGYDEFGDNVAKWVRAKHVTTDQHWMFQQIVPNKLIKNI